MWHIHTAELYSAVEKREVMAFTGKQMNWTRLYQAKQGRNRKMNSAFFLSNAGSRFIHMHGTDMKADHFKVGQGKWIIGCIQHGSRRGLMHVCGDQWEVTEDQDRRQEGEQQEQNRYENAVIEPITLNVVKNKTN